MGVQFICKSTIKYDDFLYVDCLECIGTFSCKQDSGKDIRYSELLLQRQHILHRYCHLNDSSVVKTPE